jgi:O-antigen/teichoic acid export membrane protein
LSGTSFLSKVLWLFSGLLLAQLINTGFAFVLPRIYEPADFAHFGIFLATVMIFFEVNNFKLDYALMLPADDRESIYLYKKAVLYSTIFSGILMGLFICYKLLPLKSHADYLGWIPVSVFINGIYQPTITWCNRHQLYKLINLSRIIQAIVTGLISCAPVLILTPRTLLIQGFVMGQLAALMVLISLIIVLLEDKLEVDDKTILKYIQFPKFGTWSSLVNTVSRNLIVYIIQIFFSPAQVGYYTFTSRLVHAPLGIVTGAVSQAFFRDASMQKDNQLLADLTKKVALSLSALSALPLILSLGWGPELFAFLFGEEWYSAGEVARWLSLWYATSLIVTPLTMLLDVKGLLRWELLFNVVFLISRLGVLLIGGIIGNFKLMLLLFCGVGVLFHMYMLLKIRKLVTV